MIVQNAILDQSGCNFGNDGQNFLPAPLQLLQQVVQYVRNLMIGLFYHLDLRFLLIHPLIVTSSPQKRRLALSRKRVSSETKRVALTMTHGLLFLRDERQNDVENVLVNFPSPHLGQLQQLMHDVPLQPHILKAISFREYFEALQGLYQDVDVSFTEKSNKGAFEHLGGNEQPTIRNFLRKLSKEGYFLLPATTTYASYELSMCFKLCVHGSDLLASQIIILILQYGIGYAIYQAF